MVLNIINWFYLQKKKKKKKKKKKEEKNYINKYIYIFKRRKLILIKLII